MRAHGARAGQSSCRKIRRRTAPQLLAFLVLLIVPMASAVPEQVHVSLAEGGGLMVQFASLEPILPSHDPGVSWRVGEGAWRWTPAELAGIGHSLSSTRSSTHIYAAPVATQHGAGTIVEYRVGTRALADGAQALQEARTIAIPPAGSLRFIAMGDIGYDGVSDDGGGATDSAPVRIRDLAMAQDADLLIVPGDLAYDDSNPGWDRFFRFLEPLAASMPFMPAIGNHERSNDVEGYRQFLARMVLPGDEQKFLFRAGPVTFIVLNSDAICTRDLDRAVAADPDCPSGTGQVDQDILAWIDAALAEAQADDNPWTIVYFHHQTYSFGRRGDDPALLRHWVPRFEAAGVDVVLAAHDHFYARSHPIRDGVMQSNGTSDGEASYPKGTGPIHVITGGGGRSLYPLRDEPLPPHMAHAQRVHHLVRFDVTPDSLTMQAIDINGTVIDTFTLATMSPTADLPAPGRTTPMASPWLLAALLGLAWCGRRSPKG